MEIKAPSVEPDADAEALFWETRLDDKKSGRAAYEHYVRVKIFTERGREKFSKFDIPFTKGKKVEEISARVIAPSGKITELQPQDIYEREIVRADDVKIKAMSFAIPGIEPGVIVEYRYKETFKGDSISGERLVFQRDIPIRRMTYYVRPYKGLFLRAEFLNMPTDADFRPATDGFSELTMTDVKSFKEEPRMAPANQVKPWALIYYDGFYSRNRWIEEAADFSRVYGEIIKADSTVKKTAADLIAGASTSDEKLQRLYEFCQRKIVNAGFDSKVSEEQRGNIKNKSAGETLKRGIGLPGHIDILFASLASAAGFNAQLVLASDRSEYFFDPNKNYHASFIRPGFIAVKVDEKWKFFNPGTPYLPYGGLVWYEEAVSAVMIGDGTQNTFKTPLSDHTKNLIKRTGKLRLLEDGTLVGDLRLEFNGQHATIRRMNSYDETDQKREKDLIDEIKRRISAAEVTDVTFENFYDNTKPLVFNLKIKAPGYAQKTGKRLLMQPGFFEYGEKPLFVSESRNYPIYFRYPWSEDDNIEITLPDKFELENTDLPNIVKDNAGISGQEIKIVTEKNLVKYERKFFFGGKGNIYFAKEKYPAIKKLFDEFYKESSFAVSLRQK